MHPHALGGDPRLAIAATRRLARGTWYDWGRIGRLLGISRQSARERFGRQLPRVAPSAAARDDFRRQHDEVIRLRNRLGEHDPGAEGDVVPW